MGAVDGKHTWIKKPLEVVLFYKDQHIFSVLLLALLDAAYCFITVNAGGVGKSNNSNIFKNSNIRRKLALD